MKKDAGREYAEIWGETLHSNRHLRLLSVLLGVTSLLLAILVLRLGVARSAQTHRDPSG